MLAVLVLAAVAGWNGTDSFAGTQLNSCNWDLAVTGGSIVQNNGLIATTSGQAGYSTAGVHSQYMLVGDFDISVEYALVSGFDAPIVAAGGFPHLNVTLRVQSESTRAIFFSRTRNAGGSGYSVYTPLAGQGSHNSKFAGSTATQGTLRITRTGSSVAMTYRETGTWMSFDTIDGLAEPLFVYLSAENVEAMNGFVARFSNFQILEGKTTSRPFTRPSAFRSRSDFHAGGVVGDYFAQEVWGVRWQDVNPLDTMKSNGFDTVRVGFTTVSSSLLRNTSQTQWPSFGWRHEFWSSLEMSTAILRQAAARGFRLNVFFFLSDQAAYSGRQKAPPEWASLTVDQLAAALEAYTFETVTHLRNQGLNVEIYDVGNEIDGGIAGYALGERIPFPAGIDVNRDFAWMRANVWSTEATLLKGAIRGIRRADPAAKIALHIANLITGDGNSQAVAFFQSMIDNGVDFEIAGLSLPYATVPWTLDRFTTDCWFQRLQELFDSLQTMGKPVLISEANYPNGTAGEVAAPMQEFPFSPSGQAAWWREMLRFLSAHPNVIGVDWFYPDYAHDGQSAADLQNGGLFLSETEVQPAMRETRVAAVRLEANVALNKRDATFSGAVAAPAFVSSWLWELGDGATASTATPRHTYAGPGTYQWPVTATTDRGVVYTTGTVTVAGRRHAVRH